MKLFRSALNLLTNASKATETGSIYFRISVKQMDDEMHGNGIQKIGVQTSVWMWR